MYDLDFIHNSSHATEQQRRNFEGATRCSITSETTFPEGRRDPGETHQGWTMPAGFTEHFFPSQNHFESKLYCGPSTHSIYFVEHCCLLTCSTGRWADAAAAGQPNW